MSTVTPLPLDTPLCLKFLRSAASVPWRTLTGTRFTNAVMRDLDGDGFEEVLMTVPDPSFSQPASIGVLSYMDCTQMSTEWGNATPNPSLIETGLLAVSTGLYSDGSYCTVQGDITGADEPSFVVFDNLSTLTLLQWQPNGFISLCSFSGQVVTTGSDSWTLAPGQVILAADVDGDGTDEVILFDPSALQIAVLRWSQTANSLQLVSLQSGTVPGAPGQPAWQIDSANLWAGKLASNDAAQVLVQDGGSNLWILGWGGSALQVEAQYSGSVPGSGGSGLALDTPLRLYIADLDNDGSNEIFAVREGVWSSFISGYSVAVLTGTADSLTAADVTQQVATGNLSFACIGTPSAVVSSLTPDAPCSIYLVNPGTGIALLNWTSSSGFSLAAVTSSFPAVSSGDPTWTLTDDIQLALADVDGDGVRELIVQSDANAALGVLKAAGTSLQTLWLGNLVTGSPAYMQAWGPGFLCQAPATSFSPFPGDQQAIYLAINGSLNPAVQLEDLRAEYTNSNDGSGTFSQWQGQLAAQVSYLNGPQPNPNSWPWIAEHGYSASDCMAVFTTLENELAAIPPTVGYFGSVATTITATASQAKTDLSTVQHNLTVQPQSDTQVGYWDGQVLVAAIWAIAALPTGPEIQVPMAAIASLLGAVLSASGSDVTTTIDYSTICNQIEVDMNSALRTAAAQEDLLLQDPVKLAMLSVLMQGAWSSNSANILQTVYNASAFNRLYFYRWLLPMVYQFWHWRQTGQQAPWVTNYVYGVNPVYSTTSIDLSQSNGATWCLGSGPYDLYLLGAQVSRVENPDFPGQDLYDDLFTSSGLNLPIGPIVQQTQGWNVPVVLYSMGDPGANPYFYVYNPGPASLWVTIYKKDLFNRKITEAGNCDPGQIYQSQNSYEWDSTYWIRGQMNSADTTIEMNPSWNANGATATQNTFVQYNFYTTSSGQENAWWQMLL